MEITSHTAKSKRHGANFPFIYCILSGVDDGHTNAYDIYDVFGLDCRKTALPPSTSHPLDFSIWGSRFVQKDFDVSFTLISYPVSGHNESLR